MRLRLLLPVIFFGALVAAPSVQAAVVYTVDAHDVYVRNKVAGYVIGTLLQGQTIDVQSIEQNGRWAYGRAHSDTGTPGTSRCGWVEVAGKRRVLRRTKLRAPSACPHSQTALAEGSLFQPRSYLAHAGTGAVIPVTVKAPCVAYGNYNPGTGAFSMRYGVMPAGRGPEAPGFGQRYVSADGRAAMVKDTHNPAGAPTWFFIAADCLDGRPVYMGRLPSPLAQNGLVAPKTFEPYKDAFVTGIDWGPWRALRVEGRGVARVNTCKPICALARIEHTPGARITVSDPRAGTCRGQAAYFYTTAAVTWPRRSGVKPRTKVFPLSAGC